MKISDVIRVPLQADYGHLKQALQATSWRNRLVHAAVDGRTLLLSLLGLAVLIKVMAFVNARRFPKKKPLPILPSIYRPFFHQSDQPIPTKPLEQTVEQFLKEQPDLNTFVTQKIQKIQAVHQAWTEEKKDYQWTVRKQSLLSSISQMFPLLESKMKSKSLLWTSPYEQLIAMHNELQRANVGYNIYEKYQDFQKITESCLETEKKIFSKWEKEFKKVQVPNIRSYDDYLSLLGLSEEKAFSEYFEVPKETLSARGIKSLKDLDRLQLRSYDLCKTNLTLFGLVLNLNPENKQVQDTYANYLKVIDEQLKNDLPLLTPLIQEKRFFIFARQFSEKLSNLSTTPASDRLSQLNGLKNHFFILDTLKQKLLLKAYLTQNGCADVWQSIKTTHCDMTLETYCAALQITDPSQLYRLGSILN